MMQTGIRPVWLRAATLVIVAALHAWAVLSLTIPRPELPTAVDSIEITIAPGMAETEPPEPPPEPAPKPEPPPEPPKPEPAPPPPPPPPPPVVEPPPPEPPPEPSPPEPPPPVVSPPPVVPDPPKAVVPDAPVIALPPRPKPPPPRPQPRQVPKPKTPEPVQAQAPAPTPPPQPPQPPQSNPTAAAEAEAALTQARMTYGAKIRQEISNHRVGVSGVGKVGVSFSIDATGTMQNVSIVKSSGNDELDDAALRMVRAARPGPPPDGHFAATTVVNFFAK